MAHEQIEAEEEERVREFQGLPSEDEVPTGSISPSSPVGGDSASGEQQKVLGDVKEAVSPFSSPRVPPGVANVAAAVADEAARLERAVFAKAQAAKFGKDVKEAGRRGEWGTDSFARPKDAADRLRKNVPSKYKVRRRL
jgi:hypothetical protein